MIEIPCRQGSPEWFAARVGIPSASNFHRIISPKTGKPLAGAVTYRNELLAEWMLGASLDSGGTNWTDRGLALEDSAVKFYELQRELDTSEIGFIMHDTLPVGCSPDRLVGEDGGLEIKCPSPGIHVGYLLGMADQYKAQVQGALWITGRQWWDLMSYNPELPPALVRVQRDVEFITKLDAAITDFIADIAWWKYQLIERGYTDKTPTAFGGGGMDADSNPGGAIGASGSEREPTPAVTSMTLTLPIED
jgi:hypothetical protein